MANFDNPLNNVKIASPCPANWDAMNGNDKVRFCAECKLNVYNLSGMKKQEAENLLRNTQGRLCVRYFRRADGTILTQDCPVGWRALKKRVSNLAAAACTLVLGIMSSIMLIVPNGPEEQLLGELVPLATPTPTPRYVMGNISVRPTPTPVHKMGVVAMPSPTPKATPTPDGQYMMGRKAAPQKTEADRIVVIDGKPEKLTTKAN